MMGKYMRKAKTTGEVAVMEVAQSSFGVRTRAKTLALQRLQKSQSPAPSPAQTSSGSYLQLRSRRLEKPPVLIRTSQYSKRQRQGPKDAVGIRNPKSIPNTRTSSRLRAGPVVSESNASVSLGRVGKKEGSQRAEEASGKVAGKVEGVQETHENVDVGGEEASFGENVLEFEGRERSTRESTPCSLIRDPDIVRTPGSTTRPTCTNEANQRAENSIRRHIPTAREMDEFFAGAEEVQQRKFIEKYNFDPVNDKPLPGRYEWEKLEP